MLPEILTDPDNTVEPVTSNDPVISIVSAFVKNGTAPPPELIVRDPEIIAFPFTSRVAFGDVLLIETDDPEL